MSGIVPPDSALRERVIVVGGAPGIQGYTVSLLEDAGYDATAASDLSSVFYGADVNAVDLVLVDISTPGVSTAGLVHLGQTLSDSPPAIIALAPDRYVASRLLEADSGLTDFVGIPFDPAELKARVRAALRSKRLRDVLLRQATTDSLTGLANRRYLDLRTDAAIAIARRHRRPLTCILLDLDDFKAINDRYGHGAGDEVLWTVARHIRAASRTSDILGRYGGDEFVLVMPETDEQGGVGAAEKIRASLADAPLSIAAPGHPVIRVRTSIGVAGWTSAMDTPSAFYAAADRALYHAKSLGRDRVVPATSLSAA
jgi:two-component system, cell cycle response regulator